MELQKGKSIERYCKLQCIVYNFVCDLHINIEISLFLNSAQNFAQKND